MTCTRGCAPRSTPASPADAVLFSRTPAVRTAAEIAVSEERAVTSDDVDVGFYEEPGLPLADAVCEQVSLWLPVRELCREDCKGLCPQCGANLNEERCDCQEDFADSRWDALRKLKLDDNNPS